MMLMTYEEIFESDGMWLLGRTMLTDIIASIKGKSLLARRDSTDLSKLNIEIPFPLIQNDLDGKPVSIHYMIPVELRGIFNERINTATSCYLGHGGYAIIRRYLGSPMNADTLSRIQADLSDFEMDRERQDQGQLWRIVAGHLGLAS